MTKSMQPLATATVWILALLLFAARFASAQAVVSNDATPFHQDLSTHRPLEIGAIVQSGFGLTQNRDGFKFLMAGVHAGKVLTPNIGHGPLRGNVEYAVEVTHGSAGANPAAWSAGESWS